MQLADLIPKEGIFSKYLEIACNLTDAPEIFHIGSCLAMVSAAVSKYCRVAIPVRIQNTDQILESRSRCNLWVLLSGPSGGRKTAAMNIATEISQKVTGPCSSIAGSPEATFDEVASDPNTFFYHSEGAELFSQLQASYWLQGQGLLCSLYDGAEEYSRKLVGRRTEKKFKSRRKESSDEPAKSSSIKVVIKNPTITMLIGIPPDKLNETRRSDWTGGLIGRMLILYGERTRYQPLLLRDDHGSQVIIQELEDIRRAIDALGTISLTMDSSCVTEYYKWSRKIDIEMNVCPDKTKALYARLSNHVLRVAALYAVTQFHDRITMDSMVPALRLGDESKKSIKRLGDILADDIIMRNSVKILDMLHKSDKKTMSIGAISDTLSLSWSTIYPALQSLETSGKIRIHLNQDNPKAKWIELVQ